jgi:hypothetical protein
LFRNMWFFIDLYCMCLVWRRSELILTELILIELIMSKSELNVIDLCLDKVTKTWFLSIHVVWIIRIKIDFECIITKKGFKFDTLIFKIECISILYNYLNILLHLVIYRFSTLLTMKVIYKKLCTKNWNCSSI